ncbi:MAG TPA: MarR family winged helix-turn-helix transcriptional regulator [Actinomycetaceae bacterium]|nr:MarR family winged helix-turn-helix transcriptional regulator [Actinomycetaceae bacterium]
MESGAEQRNHKFSPDMVMNTPSVVAIDVPLPAAMDLSKFTPRALARISSIFSNRESESLQEEFGLGSTDWRIMATLAIEPGQTATEVSAASVMSKAAISRSLAGLVERGYIAQGEGPRGTRPLRLTPQGAEIYERMLPITMRAQRLIEETLTEEEHRNLDDYLRRLLAAVEDLDAWNEL